MKNYPWEKWVPGVLSNIQIKKLVDDGYIRNLEKYPDDIGYSSFDLHLKSEVYEMTQGAIKPNGAHYAKDYLRNPKFSRKIPPESDNNFKLWKKHTYVIPLEEEFAYPSELAKAQICGQATAKSSIGRVDVLARLIVDGTNEYESFKFNDLEKSSGQLFLEVTPITFNVRVKGGIGLSQLRLFLGEPSESEVDSKILFKNTLKDSSNTDNTLSVNLMSVLINKKEVVAYKAKETEEVVQLWDENSHDPNQFWETVGLTFEEPEHRFQIDKGSFYILRSFEKISLPESIAVYCKAMDESLGEMRIHYAGFVHPYFGFDRDDGEKGTPLIFEVRGHDVFVNLVHREKLAKLIFYRMSQNPLKGKTEKYDTQDLTLSKFFRQF
ncbi:MAG: 2'-deoxycytidine 5'-triphosphate deaminase [Bacteroidota bacterium]